MLIAAATRFTAMLCTRFTIPNGSYFPSRTPAAVKSYGTHVCLAYVAAPSHSHHNLQQ